MDLERKILISVQLDKFKNIELFKQGLYQVKIRVAYELNRKIIFARPLKLWRSFSKTAKKNCYYIFYKKKCDRLLKN